MNEIKTFKAESMQAALAIVRQELGSDAVILNTRQISHRRLIPFLKKRQEVEVTAGVSAGTIIESDRFRQKYQTARLC
jgi:flagellar biosynthesis protein FlhF